ALRATGVGRRQSAHTDGVGASGKRIVGHGPALRTSAGSNASARRRWLLAADERPTFAAMTTHLREAALEWLRRPARLLIDGVWLEEGRAYETVNPANGKVLGSVYAA